MCLKYLRESLRQAKTRSKLQDAMLAEETGYRAENIEYLTRYYPSVGYCQESLYMYLCTGLTKGETCPDEDEAIDIYEYSFEELCDMIDRGELEDGKSIAALFAASLRITKKGK